MYRSGWRSSELSEFVSGPQPNIRNMDGRASRSTRTGDKIKQRGRGAECGTKPTFWIFQMGYGWDEASIARGYTSYRTADNDAFARGW